MKSGTTNQQQSNKPKDMQSGKKPENKNKLDSREGEEQQNKGDDVTHNKKDKHNEPKKHRS
jgi:hypothetical protein